MKEITKALAAFQAKVKPVMASSNGQVGKRTYKYAPLETIIPAVQGLMTECGLLFFATMAEEQGPDGPAIWLTGHLVHSQSGEEITSRFPVKPDQQTPQAIGSAMTYGRRYLLVAMLNLVAEADDDGAAAMPQPQQRQSHRPAPTVPPVHPTAPKALPKGAITEQNLIAGGWDGTFRGPRQIALKGKSGKVSVWTIEDPNEISLARSLAPKFNQQKNEE